MPERVGQRFSTVRHGFEERGHGVRQRRQPVAQCLRQRLQHAHQPLADQPRDEPREARGIDLVQQLERDRQGKAIVRLAGREAILERQFGARHGEPFREERLRHVRRRMAHQHVARHVQRAWIAALGPGPPSLEGRERMDALGDPLGVEARNGLVADENVLPSRLVLELGDLRDEFPVVRKERALCRERARHECLADEDLARGLRIDVAERNPTPGHQRQAVDLHTLAGGDLAALVVPPRLEIVAGHAIACDCLDPFRLDPRRAAREQPRGFNELGGQHPFGPLLRHPGSGMDVEPDPPRAEIPLGVPVEAADVAEQIRRAAPRGSTGNARRRWWRAGPVSIATPAPPPRPRAAHARPAIRAGADRRRTGRDRHRPAGGATGSRRASARRTARAPAARGNPSARHGKEDAPGRPPAAARAVARADPAPTARSR